MVRSSSCRQYSLLYYYVPTILYIYDFSEAWHVINSCNIAKLTFWRIEEGDSGVAMENYHQVLIALGLDKDMLQLAADDEFLQKNSGRRLIYRTKRIQKE